MNELKRCPRCNNHPTIQLLKDIIHFHCNCGYHKAINFNNKYGITFIFDLILNEYRKLYESINN